ncbi:hypothetical protein [Polaribacter butkevichii]|uniref:Uncharacterized protein n=1 Tax=Polaribacter butkevichii TaxID=218490 RepID=A0A2P6CDB7_9FLAO|nr:hypothetical protein [Polaribacter butkevichii]PQJ72900.1 hypothetical protein BTO14_06330 [Polaribacter butkevichii]
MKTKILTVVLITFVGFIGMAQQSVALLADQNPNYQTSLQKYTAANEVNSITLLQGTTVQETYTAIDPMEAKRQRKELRKYFRSQRPLWRHQERLERAKNPATYYHSGYNGFSNNYRYNRFNNGYLNSNSLLNLGLLGYLIFD